MTYTIVLTPGDGKISEFLEFFSTKEEAIKFVIENLVELRYSNEQLKNAQNDLEINDKHETLGNNTSCFWEIIHYI